MTIDTKLETKDQLAIGVKVSFLAVRNNIGIVIRLSEKINYPNHLFSELVRMIGVLLYYNIILKNDNNNMENL